MDLNSDLYLNGQYLQNNPTWDVEDSPWKAQVIHGLLKKNNIRVKDVVEIGCGAGGILEQLALLEPSVAQFRGYDISPQAIELAKKKETERIRFYQQDFLAGNEKGELLLLIDVLEHIADYYGFLEKLRTKGKQFVFHIPLDASCRTLLKPWTIKQQRDAVGHLHYFSEEMVLWFLKDTRFEIIDWMYTKPVPDTQPSRSFIQGIKKNLRNISFSLNKPLSVKLWGGYSMMILAQ